MQLLHRRAGSFRRTGAVFFWNFRAADFAPGFWRYFNDDCSQLQSPAGAAAGHPRPGPARLRGTPQNWIQRHPTLTAIGAGVATHHALKVAARNRKLHGQRLNWAQRHPTLSAIGVGAATHHVIKSHTPP